MSFRAVSNKHLYTQDIRVPIMYQNYFQAFQHPVHGHRHTQNYYSASCQCRHDSHDTQAIDIRMKIEVQASMTVELFTCALVMRFESFTAACFVRLPVDPARLGAASCGSAAALLAGSASLYIRCS